MKITTLLVTVLVLTALILTGCGCRNSKPLDTMPSENTTVPTTLPTTAPTTEATTMPTTEATTLPTMDNTDATIDYGNGPMPTDNEDIARGRRVMPKN